MLSWAQGVCVCVCEMPSRSTRAPGEGRADSAGLSGLCPQAEAWSGEGRLQDEEPLSGRWSPGHQAD